MEPLWFTRLKDRVNRIFKHKQKLIQINQVQIIIPRMPYLGAEFTQMANRLIEEAHLGHCKLSNEYCHVEFRVSPDCTKAFYIEITEGSLCSGLILDLRRQTFKKFNFEHLIREYSPDYSPYRRVLGNYLKWRCTSVRWEKKLRGPNDKEKKLEYLDKIKCTHRRLDKFLNIYKKNLHKNVKNSPKIFKNKI